MVRWRSASVVLLDRTCRTTWLLRVLACSLLTLCRLSLANIEPTSPSTRKTSAVCQSFFPTYVFEVIIFYVHVCVSVCLPLCVTFVCVVSWKSLKKEIIRHTNGNLPSTGAVRGVIQMCRPDHPLNHLPPPRVCDSLRTRGHRYQLPDYASDLHKCAFVTRCLYEFV